MRRMIVCSGAMGSVGWDDVENGRPIPERSAFSTIDECKTYRRLDAVYAPILTLFRSTPFVNPTGHADRTTAFGDTALAFAVAPRPFFGGHLTVAAGPTFIFPTASDHQLGQHTWQLGPDLGVVWAGKHFIAFVFPQQWFTIGGGGAKTNQLNTIWDFIYFF